MFVLLEDGIAYVRDGETIQADSRGGVGGQGGQASVPVGQGQSVTEAAEECPGECIFVEAA